MKRSHQEIDALVAEIAADHGLGGINPTERQLRELFADDREGTLEYVNLLRFRATAHYPAGHELADSGMTGEQAYMLYGAVALAHVQKRGGGLPLFGRVEQTVIGRDGGWDQVAVMRYPGREAFIDMMRDPEYRTALVHRDAGLEETVVIITRSLLPGPT